MKRKINLIIVIATILLGAFIQLFNTHYKNIFYGDAMGYYIYLPGAFISKQLKEPAIVNNLNALSETRKQIRIYQKNCLISPKGYYLNQYTYGVAFLESPFFLIAHIYEKLTDNPANGFTDNYKTAIKTATLFYAILGLYILFLSLIRFFDSTISLLGLSLLVLGTNYLWFSIVQAGMAHILIFFLVSCLIYLSILIHEKPKFKYFILFGFTLGLIGLIRPTDIIFASIPILYGIKDWATLKNKFNFIWRHKMKIILTILIMILPLIPQMLYWKSLTGHFLFYSYGNQEFEWKNPHIMEGLFSFKNGWLVYSPLMFMALAGMLFARKLSSFLFIILLTLPIYIYVIYAWYCYNYINGLGSRPMIHIYPLLAFPLVAFIQYISRQKQYIKIPFAVIVLFLCSISYSYSIQQIKGNLWSENSTKTFNLTTLFRYQLNYNDLVCFDNEIIQPKAASVSLLQTIRHEHYEKDTSKNVIFDSIRNSNVYHMYRGMEYPERLLEFTYNKDLHRKAQWIKCSGQFYAPEYCEFYKNNMIVLEIKRGDETHYWKSCIINNKIGLVDIKTPDKGFNLFEERMKKWGSVYFYAPLPNDIQSGDQIRMIIWGIDKRELLMDDLKLELYQ